MFSEGFLLQVDFEDRKMAVKFFQFNVLCIKESVIKRPSTIMFEVKSLCSYSCDRTGEENNIKKITDEMRKRNDTNECVNKVLKSRIIRSFSCAKLGGFLHYPNRQPG